MSLRSLPATLFVKLLPVTVKTMEELSTKIAPPLPADLHVLLEKTELTILAVHLLGPPSVAKDTAPAPPFSAEQP
jgi:hypothetical protein